MSKEERTVPPLPMGSIDGDKLHAADAKKADLADAVQAALVEPKPHPKPEAEAAPAPASTAAAGEA